MYVRPQVESVQVSGDSWPRSVTTMVLPLRLEHLLAVLRRLHSLWR